MPGFYIYLSDGSPVHINGDPTMSEDELAALRALVEAARAQAQAEPPSEDDAIGDSDPPLCVYCGETLEWEPCNSCDGYGYLDWETLQFDDPLWYQPDDTEPCEECQGKGGWWECPNVPHSEPKEEPSK